ncbi:MAG: universal stress protein [Opitutales bacterium]|nr:universal stress protein [Opitutales bacterium]
MIQNILTCTDGSVYAPSVYDLTAWAAKRSDAAVHVLHMLDPRTNVAGAFDLSGNLEPGTGAEVIEEIVKIEETKSRLLRERGKVILTNARKHLADAGVTRVSVEQQNGRLVESVTRMEKEKQADLIVIGKRGEAADFDKLHLGSNLERVIRGSARPVLVAARKFVPIERFLIAYDGGPSAEKAIRFAMEQPLLEGLECHLVRAGKIDEKAEWYLQEAAGKLRETGYTVHAEAIAGTPETVISGQVTKHAIQLLVMGAYGHSRIRQLMVGSTTTEMVRTCQIPVLMFR